MKTKSIVLFSAALCAGLAWGGLPALDRAMLDVFGPALQVVCAALLACIAIALPFVWMGERGVRPLAAFRDLLRLQTWAGRIVLCLLFACGAHVCGSKPASPHAAPPAVRAPAARFADAPVLRTYAVCDPAVDGFFDAWTNAVADACFTGVRPGPAADLLRVAWPGLADRPAQAMPFLEFYACRDLASDQSFP